MTLADAVAAVPYWYHRIELPGGVVTPGWAPIVPEAYQIPDDLTGARVLDVGAWDGYWTWEALRRGAAHVHAIDDFSDMVVTADVPRDQSWDTFDLCADALGYGPDRVSREECNVYDVTGDYDVVFFFGVLYHLKHPLLGLERMRQVCRGSFHMETAILDGLGRDYDNGVHHQGGFTGDECVMEFYPGSEFGKCGTNWWVPTLKCAAMMTASAGFATVRAWWLAEKPASLQELRGFVQAHV